MCDLTRLGFAIAPEKLVSQRQLLQGKNTARIEISGSFEIPHGLFPSPLTPLDVAFQLKNPGIIWQCLDSNLQFREGAIMIKVSAIEIFRACQVRFSCIWKQARCCLDSCFRHHQARGATVVTEKVAKVLSICQLAVCLKK